MDMTKAANGTEPGGKAKPAAWFRPLRWFFDSAMRATVIGAILLAGLVWVYHQVTDSPPPSTSTVTSLMRQEAAASVTRDTALVEHIYSPDAVVTDAACGQPGASQTWKGYGQLDARYLGLSGFLWLQHIFAQVTWDPGNSSASTATATAETAGVMLPATKNGKSQSIVGRELWTFVIVDGQWRITSFTYNMCVPPGIGG
jgi:uncharacterized protein YchJ